MPEEKTLPRREFEARPEARPLLVPARGGRLLARPATIVVRDEAKLKVGGASGVVALGRGRFAVVDDDKGVYQVEGTGAERVLPSKIHELLEDLEGLCPAPEDDALLALSERTGGLFRLGLTASGDVDGARDPERLGSLPEIGKGRNKGWEGLDLVPAECCPDGVDRLVAVHEGFPRKVGFFPLASLEPELLLDLPEEIEDDALDLSDVALDRRTGHIFLLSDESASLVEVRLVRGPGDEGEGLAGGVLEPLGVHELDLSRKEKAEALDFDTHGVLWLATDRKARIYRLEVQRA